jgi:hypothetical protein
MLLSRISLSSSDFGSRAVHIRNSGLLGNRALTVPVRRLVKAILTPSYSKRH